MVTVRRWYIFLVCAVSLQSVVWAIIALLRNLLMPSGEAPITAIAFQLAIIVIGLPIFLVHWLWAQRLAVSDQERASTLRRLYLYGTLAIFLSSFVDNAFRLVRWLLWLAFGGSETGFGDDEFFVAQAIIRALIALVVLALLWLYHQRVAASDSRAVPEVGNAATVRRLYLFAFSASGCTMTIIGIIELVRWIMVQFGSQEAVISSNFLSVTDEVARLIVGLPLWLVFWRWAQKLFAGPSEEERQSALRKFYLYVTVFIAVLAAVTNVTFVLAGLLRRMLELETQGDIRQPLATIIGMVVLWAYHTYILKADVALADESPRQVALRQLYLYLIAAIGLGAFLVGLGGDISVLIRSLSTQVFEEALREQLAWFTAALIAGLPVWLIPWRQAQTKAIAMTPGGVAERRSVVRDSYLYFYLFVATVTALSSMVYIVYQTLSLTLGGRDADNLVSELGQAIAFSLIAVGVWLYHGMALRSDGRLNKHAQVQQLAEVHVAVVDVEDGHFGRAILDGLRRELPSLTLKPIGLSPSAMAAMGVGGDQAAVTSRLAEANLIVGPWNMLVSGEAVTAEFARAVGTSPARKVLIPTRVDGWEWAGVDRWNTESIVQQTLRAVKQVAQGEDVKPARPLSVGAIIGIVIGIFILLILIAIPVLLFFSGVF